MPGIGYMDYYIPKKIETIEEFFDNRSINGFNSIDEITNYKKRSGIKRVPIANDISNLDMIRQLMDKYVSKTGVSRQSIRYIFFTDPNNLITADNEFVPFIIQREFSFDKASVIVLDQQCASTTWILGPIGRSINEDEVALIISSSKVEDEKRFMGFTVAGDGAALAEIRNDKIAYEIIDHLFISEASKPNDDMGNTFAFKNGIKYINDLLKRNSLTINDIATFIPQNLSNDIYRILYSRLLNLPNEKFFMQNIEGGHIGDVNTIMNCLDFYKNNSVTSKSYILIHAMGAFGNNLNFNCILAKIIV